MPVESEVDPRIDTIEPPQYFLRTFNENGEVATEIALKKYLPVYVGRAIGCFIDIAEPSISRRHCVFQYKDLIVDSFGNQMSGFMIYDLKSSHGTFLNGERIPSMENIKLHHGDEIKLGQSMKIFTFWDSKHGETEEGELQSSSQMPISEGDPSEAGVHDSLLQQQPSSTSQTAEHEQSLDESDVTASNSWLQKYINILNQLADSAKEYEEYGVPVPNFNLESRLSKKLKLEHTKLVQQAQIVAELLALIGTDESMEEEEPVSNRKRYKERVPDNEITPPKRSKKRKSNESEGSALVKKRSSRAKKELEAEMNVLTPPRKSSKKELYQEPTEPLVAQYRGSDDFEFTYEQDPLALPTGPKFEDTFEEEVQEEVQEEEFTEEISIKVPSRKGRKKKVVSEADPSPARPATEKKPRGRPPKDAVKENKKKKKTEKVQKKRNSRKVETAAKNRRSSLNKTSESLHKKSSPLKPINGNSSKRGRKRKEPQTLNKSTCDLPSSRNAQVISLGSATFVLKQPIVLLQKLKIK